MVRPGAGKGASMTLCMKGWTKAGEISLLLSTSSKIYSQTFQAVTLQHLSKRFSADKTGNSYLISEMPLTFEKRLKQPSLLMMQWTSGSLFPFPQGCRTHRSKIKCIFTIENTQYTLITHYLFTFMLYQTCMMIYVRFGMTWWICMFGQRNKFFCWINMTTYNYKLTRILRQYPNKRLPSSPVRTKENVSLWVIIKDHIRRVNKLAN